MRTRLAVAALLLTSLTACHSPRVHRAYDAPVYPPTNADEVRVITDVPAGAIVLGEVEGTGHALFGDAMTTALRGAASLGADAIVVHGGAAPDSREGGNIGETRTMVRATAVRLAR